MITLLYDQKKSVNHGVPGSSPGEGANRKVTRNGDFFVYNLPLFLLFFDFCGSNPVISLGGDTRLPKSWEGLQSGVL